MRSTLKFLSVQHSTLLSTATMLYSRPRTYSSCITEPTYLLNSNSLCPPPPAPGNQNSVLCFHESDYFKYLIRMESCSVCPCDWITSLNIMSSRFIHVVAYYRIFSFSRWMIFHCMRCIKHLNLEFECHSLIFGYMINATFLKRFFKGRVCWNSLAYVLHKLRLSFTIYNFQFLFH